MAYPGSSPAASPRGYQAAGSTGLRRPASAHPAPSPVGRPLPRSSENDHQLEKLEFALAVAITRGDATRIARLREQIAALGGNWEEPGT
jgi:hypothetical protein